jgi:hypothetical protein
MFVRSRLQSHRIHLSIVDTYRVDGRVQSTHVAALGSVPSDMGAVGRAVFWKQAERRVDKLGNRINKGTRDKLLAELRAKIPVPTKAEIELAEREVAAVDAAIKNMPAILLKAGWSTADIVRKMDAEFQVGDRVRLNPLATVHWRGWTKTPFGVVPNDKPDRLGTVVRKPKPRTNYACVTVLWDGLAPSSRRAIRIEYLMKVKS